MIETAHVSQSQLLNTERNLVELFQSSGLNLKIFCSCLTAKLQGQVISIELDDNRIYMLLNSRGLLRFEFWVEFWQLVRALAQSRRCELKVESPALLQTQEAFCFIGNLQEFCSFAIPAALSPSFLGKTGEAAREEHLQVALLLHSYVKNYSDQILCTEVSIGNLPGKHFCLQEPICVKIDSSLMEELWENIILDLHIGSISLSVSELLDLRPGSEIKISLPSNEIQGVLVLGGTKIARGNIEFLDSTLQFTLSSVFTEAT